MGLITIVVEVNGRRYSIDGSFSVSEGPAKEFIEHCIEIAQDYYKGPSNGFVIPNLYMNLGRFKSIKLISVDWKPPKNSKDAIY